METTETTKLRTETVGLCTTCAHCIPDDPATNGQAARTCALMPWLPLVLVLLTEPGGVALDHAGHFSFLTTCETYTPAA